MEIKRLKNARFGNKLICQVVTGWGLYEHGKGWVAFSSDRDRYGILQAILDAGGFVSFENMEYVQELGR